MTARVALYYAPAASDPLTAAGAAWLGRDIVTNAPVRQPDVPDIQAITAEPRVYGLHATLKPPMRLIGGWRPLMSAVREMTAGIAPFDLPRLEVADLHGFLALRETSQCPPLRALADVCVEHLDPFRQPPGADELARRRSAKLSAEQDAMLVRWGYPYVFGSWFFHMTLTRRLSQTEKAAIMPAADAWFAPALALPRRVEDVCLFTQAAPGAAFTLAERFRLRG